MKIVKRERPFEGLSVVLAIFAAIALFHLIGYCGTAERYDIWYTRQMIISGIAFAINSILSSILYRIEKVEYIDEDDENE